MPETDKKSKQKKLNEFLRKISKEDDAGLTKAKFDEFARELSSGVYQNGFRHSYSELFPIIAEITKENKLAEQFPLQTNLQKFYDFLLRNKNEALAASVCKLLDHVNLEFARMTFLYSGPVEEVNELRKKQEETNNQIKKTKKDTEKMYKEAKNIQIQVISILGVFSAIVISFSGGLTFMGSVLSGLKDVSVLKAMILTLACGFVLYNIIFMMIYFLGRLTGRNLCGLKSEENAKKFDFNFLFFFFIDAVILFLLCMSICFYSRGAFVYSEPETWVCRWIFRFFRLLCP